MANLSITTEFDCWNIKNTETRKAASVRENGGESGAFHCIFGRISGGAFQVSVAKPSRFYKSRAAAERAARKWVA